MIRDLEKRLKALDNYLVQVKDNFVEYQANDLVGFIEVFSGDMFSLGVYYKDLKSGEIRKNYSKSNFPLWWLESEENFTKALKDNLNLDHHPFLKANGASLGNNDKTIYKPIDVIKAFFR